MNKHTQKIIPKDGIEGLKQNFSADAISGFIVFLLALPLSLGIAKASEFPPVMGLLTAIIGAIVVSFFAGSKLTIKGPAAGLIVIVAGAVHDFGGGVTGWKLALGAMVVAGLFQILFGVFKLGKYVDFFPLSAIHGMLAAIGLIIIAKQIPVLLNVDPSLTSGKNPIQLLLSIPEFIHHLNPVISVIGCVSLLIMFGLPMIKNPIIRKVPAPLLVLLIAIPSSILLDLKKINPEALVHFGNLTDNLKINADFGGISQIGIFIKYVIMLAVVGSLESLLTVKAIDILDPFKRKSDNNKDLIAIGIGNTIAAVLGGLPMISEVARSSANVNNGAKTRWANFFHGFFILVFVLLGADLIQLIPNAALAAMLIAVGFKLAHPKEFVHMFKIGKEQLAIFFVTIFFTLIEDLLIGIAAGLILKLIIHLFNGAPLSGLFSTNVSVLEKGDSHVVTIDKCAVFSNYLGIKSYLDQLPQGKKITIDLSNARLVDYSVMSNLKRFQQDYEDQNGTVAIIGLENHRSLSAHSLAARKK